MTISPFQAPFIDSFRSKNNDKKKEITRGQSLYVNDADLRQIEAKTLLQNSKTQELWTSNYWTVHFKV